MNPTYRDLFKFWLDVMGATVGFAALIGVLFALVYLAGVYTGAL